MKNLKVDNVLEFVGTTLTCFLIVGMGLSAVSIALSFLLRAI